MTVSSKNYPNKLADFKIKNNLLKNVVRELKTKHHLIPCIGVELEFYLVGGIDVKLLEQRVGINIKKEKGHNQFEIDLPPSRNIINYAKKIKKIKEKIKKYAHQLGGHADFRSKPFLEDYGSSMHIHLNFIGDKNEIEKYAIILCHYLPKTIQFFIPHPRDFIRLDSKFMAPTHISYGNNNRTTLIRIPDSAPRRLEHRLATADADPELVIYTILNSINEGLLNPSSIKFLPKTYGNAFDPQYKLQEIIR